MNDVVNGLAPLYPWVKALHIISVIAWMSGLLYLPRLFVYHCEVEPGSVEDKRFQLMERRLLRLIMMPAMIATYLFGIWLAAAPGTAILMAGWFHVKIVGVLILTYLHHLMGRWRRDFAAGRNVRPARFYRLMNEIPTLMMILIVIMVVVKPF